MKNNKLKIKLPPLQKSPKASKVVAKKVEDKYQRKDDEYIHPDEDKRNILHRAALQQEQYLIKDILEGFHKLLLSQPVQHQDEFQMLLQEEQAIQSVTDRLSGYVNTPDKFGLTPVLMCCIANRNNRKACLELFFPLADFNLYNPRTLWSPAHWVAFYGDTQSLEILFKKRVIFFQQDYQGLYPCDLAGMNLHREVCRRIVLHLVEEIYQYKHFRTYNNMKVTSNIKKQYDRYLCSPQLRICLFYWACYFKFENFDYNEFQAKVDDVYCFAPYMKTTSLHIAVKQENLNAVQFILKSLNLQTKRINSLKVEKTNNRVFSFTKEELRIYSREYIHYVLELSKWINRYGLRQTVKDNYEFINQKDLYGNIPLHLAAVLGNPILVKQLLEVQSDVESENKEFWKPIDLSRDPEIIEIFNNNESAKTKLQNSIHNYLRNCPVVVDKKARVIDTLGKNYSKMNDIIQSEYKAKIYQLCDELQTPDYVLKCHKKYINKMNFQIQLLLNAEFQVYLTRSEFDDHYFVLLKYPLAVLEQQAFLQRAEIKLIDSYDYEPYDCNNKAAFEPFRSLQRQAIIKTHLNKILNVKELTKQKQLIDAFPVHTFGGAAKIRYKWIEQPKWYWPQPLNQFDDYLVEGSNQNFASSSILRLYFGEKIAFFFAWKSYLTCITILVAVPGAILQLYILIANDFQTMFIPLWVIYLSIWSTVSVEFWKRKACEINARWGMLDLMNDDKLKPRQEFSGDEELNLVTKEVSKHYKEIYTVIVFVISIPLLIILTSLVIGIFVSVQYLQTQFPTGTYASYYKITAGVVQGIFITILNIIYTEMVAWFVDKENHKYQQNHESSLIYKNVLFKFINSYLAVFYTAFVKADSTLDEVFYLLLPVLIIKQVSYIAITVMIPQLIYKWKEDKYFNKQNKSKGQVYLDCIDLIWASATKNKIKAVPRCVLNLMTGESVNNFDMDMIELNSLKLPITSTLIVNYFLESMIDFGYITLFSAAFPIGPLISMIMGIIEIRMKIYTYLFVYKKPYPDRTAGIGEWINIWRAMSFAGVFTNYALVYIKQGDTINSYLFGDNPIVQSNMMWLFILLVFVNFLLKYALQTFIPDKPAWVEQWEQELKSKKDSVVSLQKKEQEIATIKGMIQQEKRFMEGKQKYVKDIQANLLDQQMQQESSPLMSPRPRSFSGTPKANQYESKELDEIIGDEVSQVDILKFEEQNKSLLTYYQIERMLLIERVQQMAKLASQKQILLLLCNECQFNKVNVICKDCNIQYCQKCFSIHHEEKKHTIFSDQVKYTFVHWRKMQSYSFPTNENTLIHKDLLITFDKLLRFYNGQADIQIFLSIQEFNLEELYYINRIMYFLHRKNKVNLYLEFQKQVNIIQKGTLEQKLIQLVDFMDENDNGIIPKDQFQIIQTQSLIQDVSLTYQQINPLIGELHKKGFNQILNITIQELEQRRSGPSTQAFINYFRKKTNQVGSEDVGTLELKEKVDNVQNSERSIDEYEEPDEDHRNILHRAALQQEPKLIAEIINGYQHICLKNLNTYINTPDIFGLTAVQMCCFQNQPNRAICLKLFIEDADFNAYNPRTLWSTAHWVAFYGDTESFQILLRKKVMFFKQDYNGLYPSDLAGINDKKDCCLLIINHLVQFISDYENTKRLQHKLNRIHPDFDIYFPDQDRFITNPLLKVSLFYWSCYFNFNIAQFSKIENLYCLCPYQNATALHVAVRQTSLEAVDFIIQSLKNKTKTEVDPTNTYQDNSVFCFTKEEMNIYTRQYRRVVIHASSWIDKYKQQEFTKAEDYRQFLNMKDLFGNTPLHLAAVKNNREIINKLLELNADVEIENKEFWKPQNLTYDESILKIFSETDYSKAQLQKKIKEYLNSCPVFVNKTAKVKEKLGAKIQKYSEDEKESYDMHTLKIYNFCNQLITPDFVLKCHSSHIEKVNFQIQLLINASFEVYLTKSIFDDHYFVFLKYKTPELEKQAEEFKQEIKLIDSYDYEPFEQSNKASFEPFRSLQKQSIIQTHLSQIINLKELQDHGCIIDAFATHSFGGTNKIYDKWIIEPKWYWPQPLNQVDDYLQEGANQNFSSSSIVRLYFGEKIAFYFAWKSFITCICLLVALPGLALQMYIIISGNFDTMLVPLWVIYLSLWSTISVEFWKRKSCEINARWGMLDLMNNDQLNTRQDFSGDEEANLTTKEVSKHYKELHTILISIISIPLLIILTGLVIGIFILVQFLQTQFPSGDTAGYYKIAAGVIQGIFIAIINIVYSLMVEWFVEKENHKYEQNQEQSLIYKNVLFKFINSYLAVFYTAFINTSSTLEEIFYLLLPVLIVKQVSQIGITVLLPRIIFKFKEDKYFDKISGEHRNVFQDCIEILWQSATTQNLKSIPRCVLNLVTGEAMGNFDLDAIELNSLKLQSPKNLTINYFLESMIDFGYITLFSAAFPIGPFVFMMMSILEIRMKIYTFLFVYKKPSPVRTAGIGEWIDIWQALSFFGVFSNYALVYLKQSHQINTFLFPNDLVQSSTMMWFFILLVFVNILVKQLIQVLIPDKPTWVSNWEQELELKKQEITKLSQKQKEFDELQAKHDKLQLEKATVLREVQQVNAQMKNQATISASPGLSARQSRQISPCDTPILKNPDQSFYKLEEQNQKTLPTSQDSIKLAYHQVERQLLIRQIESIQSVAAQNSKVLLLCCECQLENAIQLCKTCSLQYCQACFTQIHTEINHKVKLLSEEQTTTEWRKIQEFVLPVNQQSEAFQQLQHVYDILLNSYNNNTLEEISKIQEFNTEEKLFLNRIMYLLKRKDKVDFDEFQKQAKILQEGTMEQKIIQLVEFLDEEGYDNISKDKFQMITGASVIQDLEIKKKAPNPFEKDISNKADLIAKFISLCQGNQLGEFIKVFIQIGNKQKEE